MVFGAAADWTLAVDMVCSGTDGNARMDVFGWFTRRHPSCCTGNGKTQFTLLDLFRVLFFLLLVIMATIVVFTSVNSEHGERNMTCFRLKVT